MCTVRTCKSTVNQVWYAKSRVESERGKLISIFCTKTARITPVEQLANITSIGRALSPVLVAYGSSLTNLSHFSLLEIISDPSPTLLTTPFPISSAWRPHHWLPLSLFLSLCFSPPAADRPAPRAQAYRTAPQAIEGDHSCVSQVCTI